jgi:CheY-like chemotaxis protein
MATILLVEDEPPLLVLAESVLQEGGYETVSAATLAEAQALVHSDKNIDLVFTDITLMDAQEGGCKSGSLSVRPDRAPPCCTPPGAASPMA